ncbi:hypothetical protein [Thermodesulfovibrio yellowstonii]|nr:hypothetical protein [Thermodesulfovibrio islandicus]
MLTREEIKEILKESDFIKIYFDNEEEIEIALEEVTQEIIEILNWN